MIFHAAQQIVFYYLATGTQSKNRGEKGQAQQNDKQNGLLADMVGQLLCQKYSHGPCSSGNGREKLGVDFFLAGMGRRAKFFHDETPIPHSG